MGNDQPALRALFACEWAGARVSSFDLENEARQMGKMVKFARCPVSKNNCYNCSNPFCHFHLIWPQRPLIMSDKARLQVLQSNFSERLCKLTLFFITKNPPIRQLISL